MYFYNNSEGLRFVCFTLEIYVFVNFGGNINNWVGLLMQMELEIKEVRIGPKCLLWHAKPLSISLPTLRDFFFLQNPNDWWWPPKTTSLSSLQSQFLSLSLIYCKRSNQTPIVFVKWWWKVIDSLGVQAFVKLRCMWVYGFYYSPIRLYLDTGYVKGNKINK